MSEFSQREKISNDYTVTTETLTSDVKLPFIFIRIGLMIGAGLANILLVYYLLAYRYDLAGVIEYEIVIAIVTGITIFTLGLIGGKFWITLGYRLSRATYNVYLRKGKGIFYKIFAFMYLKMSEPNNRIYLEGKSKDPRLNNPISLMKLVFNISISQLSFFMVASAFLARPIVSYLRSVLPSDNILVISEANRLIVQHIGAMGVAVVVLGLYLPMNFILNDSNIRTWNVKEMKIGTPSQKLRSRIDRFIGIGALLTGWGLYLEETQDGQIRYLLTNINWEVQGYDFAILLDYLLWLGTLLVLAWPLIVPASIYYFTNHGKTVNKFRAEASARGVPVGVSMVRLTNPSEEELVRKFEIEQLGLEETHEDNTTNPEEI